MGSQELSGAGQKQNREKENCKKCLPVFVHGPKVADNPKDGVQYIPVRCICRRRNYAENIPGSVIRVKRIRLSEVMDLTDRSSCHIIMSIKSLVPLLIDEKTCTFAASI